MSKGIVFIIPLISLVVTITPTIAHATNSLTPFSEKSAAYNAGFSQGFTGVPLKGHHTQEFIYGYKNGTHTYWYNRGSVWGFNGLPAEHNFKDYVDGYRDGISQRNDTYIQDLNTHKLPATTDDNYLHYLIGYRDGALQEDSDHDQHYDETCPPGHTQEYCAGYSAGYNAENYVLSK